MAGGHSALEVTHPRGTQTPYIHMHVPHLGVPVQGDPLHPHVPLPPSRVPSPWGCHPAMSKASVQQLGTSLQSIAPSLGSPHLWEQTILVTARVKAGGQEGCGGATPRAKGTGGGPPATPLSPSPTIWAMPGWGELLGAVPPPPRHEGVKGPHPAVQRRCEICR